MTILKTQNAEMKVFELSALSMLEARDFQVMDVPILQNVDVILDTIGERARSELFFVESSNPEQNALRYDFTLAMARHYLRNIYPMADKASEYRYAAHGTVFRNRDRMQTDKKSEVRQISFEYIGNDARTNTDAECLAQSLSLLDGIDKKYLQIGIADIRLSRAVLSNDFIPPIKAGRLKSALRHPKKFMSLLSDTGDKKLDSLSSLGKLQHEEAEKVITDIFQMTGLKHSGLRTMDEISSRFVKKAEEAQEPPLDQDIAQHLSLFYNLECPAAEAADKMRHIMASAGINIDGYLQYFERRIDLLKSHGVDIAMLNYGPLLKRKPEYYSGFMFAIDFVSGKRGLPIGGGGRYDDLFLALGAGEAIPAVGCELRPEEIVRLSALAPHEP
ncbi:MAG: ATP phosphoribosyltransferase regulatory subunit [Pseudomonadota bacterium]